MQDTHSISLYDKPFHFGEMMNESDELEALGHKVQAGLCCCEKLSPCCLHLHATKPPFHTEENHLSAQDGPGRQLVNKGTFFGPESSFCLNSCYAVWNCVFRMSIRGLFADGIKVAEHSFRYLCCIFNFSKTIDSWVSKISIT